MSQHVGHRHSDEIAELNEQIAILAADRIILRTKYDALAKERDELRAELDEARAGIMRLSEAGERAIDHLARELASLRALLVKAGEDMVSVRRTLAALIPNPSDPKIHEWPCENGADKECLQLAYEELTAAITHATQTDTTDAGEREA